MLVLAVALGGGWVPRVKVLLDIWLRSTMTTLSGAASSLEAFVEGAPSLLCRGIFRVKTLSVLGRAIAVLEVLFAP